MITGIFIGLFMGTSMGVMVLGFIQAGTRERKVQEDKRYGYQQDRASASEAGQM